MPVYAKGGRFFGVPFDVAVASGEFEVQSLVGTRHSFDEASLAVFEITEDEAKARAERYAAGLKGLAGKLQALAAALEAVARTTSSPSVPGDVERVLGMLGVTRAELAADPRGTVARMLTKLKSLPFETVEEMG